VATINGIFGPSEVRALPFAAGINVGGHYFRYYSSCSWFHYKWHFFSLSFFLSLSSSLLILPEGVVVGIQIFAWAPK
jgi:TRAP-type mannitol/chloroaromatic compound transport system permease small subunit